MKKKGKGLSFDQKRQKLLAIFHKSKDVFNYQQVQKLGVKAGIPFPSVKEILQSLKDDSLVECQKIGAGVFYWSFPSRAHQIMNDRLQITNKQIQNFKQQIKMLQTQVEKGQAGRQQTQQRQERQQLLASLMEQSNALQKQIQKYIRFDPERYQMLLKQNKELKRVVNIQVDNLQQIKKYIKKNQIGIRDEQIESFYALPINIQYQQ